MQSTASKPQPLPPQAVVMQMVMGGWVARAVSDISRLGIPGILKRSGPMTAASLVAAGIDANPSALERVMRACASTGLFTEDAQGRFGPTELSDVLTDDSPVSVRAMAQEVGGLWLKIFEALPEAIRTEEPQSKQVLGMEFWDYLTANPKELETFGQAMKSGSTNSMRGVLMHCNLSTASKVVDVGGSLGHLVIALLDKYANLRGILLDVPNLIPLARAHCQTSHPGIAPRLEFVGGDMFESVPRGDVYILKHIIHDWTDEYCVKLLQNCNQSMEGDGRVICIDAVIPPLGDTSETSSKFLDLLMMVAIRGKERTRLQWEELYAAAGFRITSVTPLQDNFGVSIIEGVKQ
jgi:hypothetical protein